MTIKLLTQHLLSSNIGVVPRRILRNYEYSTAIQRCGVTPHIKFLYGLPYFDSAKVVPSFYKDDELAYIKIKKYQSIGESKFASDFEEIKE